MLKKKTMETWSFHILSYPHGCCCTARSWHGPRTGGENETEGRSQCQTLRICSQFQLAWGTPPDSLGSDAFPQNDWWGVLDSETFCYEKVKPNDLTFPISLLDVWHFALLREEDLITSHQDRKGQVKWKLGLDGWIRSHWGGRENRDFKEMENLVIFKRSICYAWKWNFCYMFINL